MTRGTFVVLEGIDGAGTTTQSRLLADAIRGRGGVVHATREPSDGPVGMLLRQVLTGRLVVPGETGPRAPSWASLAMLFSADRLDHCEAEIGPMLASGVTVVSDRYYHSTIAYQSVVSDDPEATAWIRTLNARAIRPDVAIVLDVPGEVAASRRAARSGVREIFDDLTLQDRLAKFYRSLPEVLPAERIVVLDATPPPETVHRAVLAAVDASGNDAKLTR